MDEFQQKNRRRRGPSMDGLLSGSGSHGAQRQSLQGEKHPHASPMRKRLDDFKSADGFHPISQPKISMSQPAQDQNAAFASQSAGTLQPQIRKARPVKTSETIDLSLDEGAKKPKKTFIQKIRSMPRKAKVAAVMVPVLLIGGFFLFNYLQISQVFKGGGGAVALQEGLDPSQLKGEGDGRINILLLGKGGEGHTAPDLTDTLLLASIDPINNTASLLSVPRDLYVEKNGSYTKINAVYANAKAASSYAGNDDTKADADGLAAIEAMVSDKLGVPIHYHMMVDFQAFTQAIDTVGGIDIDVPEEATVSETLYDHDAGRQYVLNVQEGPTSFDGKRALFYSRSRQTSARGDFDRTQRQRLVILALKEKILSAGTFANPSKISGLVDSFGDNVRINMTINEMLRLYEIGQKIDASNVASLSLAEQPNMLVQTDNINGLSVVRPVAGLDDYDDIRHYVRNTLRDGFLASEDAKVLILNGTNTVGLAAEKAEELESFGYKVIGMATAPTQNYTNTVLVNLRGEDKKFTKSYLETRLGVTAVDSLPDSNIAPGEADFVIILGSNEASNL